MTRQPTSSRPPAHFVQSLERGLAVIRAFGPDAPQMTISELAQRTEMPRPAARRFLLTLVDLGYAAQQGKYFRLRPDVLNLGFAYLSTLDVWRLGQPYLDEIAQATGETCSVSILDGPEIVYVARTHVQRIIAGEISVGSRLPAYATSMGRVLLAALPEDEQRALLVRSDLRPFTPHTVCDAEALVGLLRAVRSDGHALVDQELAAGLRSMAVPLSNRQGKVVAAINISTQAWRLSREEMLTRYLPLLRKAAADLAAKLV